MAGCRLHAVGRTSTVAPRLVLLRLTPSDPVAAAQSPIALVGKGIVFDSGGLNLKSDAGRGMKDDMSGSGAVLGAFQLLAGIAAKDTSLELKAPLIAALCLAENCIGPNSYRPDDIIAMHSGKTLEVEDTDAEGRLVVGDGCSYVARELGARVVIDAATLTGHDFTGKTHAAVMSNSALLERRCIEAGLQSGEHVSLLRVFAVINKFSCDPDAVLAQVAPMVWLPEAMSDALSSNVADMTNCESDDGHGMGSAVVRRIIGLANWSPMSRNCA